MIDDQWEIDGYLFGSGCPWGVAEEALPRRAVLTQDTQLPMRAGRLMGRDRDAAGEWEFVLQPSTGGDVLALVGELREAWQGPQEPLALSVLRYRRDGVARRVYGRPRDVTVSSVAPHQRAAGMAVFVATFDLSHPSHFSDSAEQVSLSIVPAASHGLVFPATPPFSWASMTGEPVVRDLVAGGDAPSPLSVVFRGPVSRPWVQVGAVRVQVTGDLAYDESLTVDALAGTIERQDGAAWPSMLSPATRLADLWVAPGVHEVMFGGVDVTGTATATLAWRDAWRSL